MTDTENQDNGHLDKHEYAETQMLLRSMVTLATGWDRDRLARFIATAEYADTVGPFVDPTLWQRGHEPLQDVLACARALDAFVAEVQKVRDRMEARA